MKIYIDIDYKCHVSNDGTMREFDVSFFDGKCPAFVEGYRYIPADEIWEREDGEAFKGEMIVPWKAYTELYISQLEYELADADNALAELGVTVDG